MENSGIHQMAEVLATNEISIFVPPLEFLRYFLDILPKNEQFPHIRCVILAGDVLYRRDVERMRTHVSAQAVIIHHLSSSEAGLLARKLIEPATILDSNIIPVGHPVAGKELLILDEDHKEVEAGETGEIAVRTELTFPGYWRQPDLDNGKMMPDPADSSRRIFLTGDLGKFRPDDQLEFVGRKDLRVKIRGFSVDLSAIESILNSFSEVRRAVVLARESPNGEKRLTAYVSPMPGMELATNSLRELLAARLPDFMLPKAIVILDDLPLTRNGKVDRRSLPVPDWNDQDISDAYVAPSDALEEQVARIWEKTLHVPRAGIRDRFAELGGDSLLAMAMFVELEKELGLRLPPALLVDHDTVESLVQALRSLDTLGARSLVPMRPEGNRPPLYLIPGAFGDVSVWKQALPYFSEDQPIYGLQALQRAGDSLYSLTVEQAASVFMQNIKDFRPEGPYYLAGYSFGGLIAFEIAHQMAARGDRVAFLGIVDSTAPGRRQEAKWTDRLRIHTNNLQALSLQERLKYLNERAARGLLRLSRRKLLKEAIPTKKLIGSDHLKASSRASRTYFPDPTYPGAITIFKVSEEPWYVRWDRMKGWQNLVQGSVKIIRVSGTHGNIMKDPQVRELAQGLQTEIERVS
jgi:thioesterase domain-containing protein/acyl carrier protein